MLLKYLLFLVLFYFVYRASKNIMRAVRGELDAPPSQPRFGGGASQRRDQAYRRWQDTSSGSGRGSSSSNTGSEGFWGDVEDAKWEDL
jgi:hypothetical protein